MIEHINYYGGRGYGYVRVWFGWGEMPDGAGMHLVVNKYRILRLIPGQWESRAAIVGSVDHMWSCGLLVRWSSKMLLTFSSEPFYTIRRLKNHSVYYGRIQYLGHVLLFFNQFLSSTATLSFHPWGRHSRPRSSMVNGEVGVVVCSGDECVPGPASRFRSTLGA